MNFGVNTLPTTVQKSPGPVPEVQEVIDRHAGDPSVLPTKETVAAILAEVDDPNLEVQVLKFFLVESPLGAIHLRGLFGNIDNYSFRAISNSCAREKRASPEPPRWRTPEPVSVRH